MQRRSLVERDDDSITLSPLARTRNPSWDIAIYSLDVLICGLVTYYSGPIGGPPFGDGSPFYRYGLSTIFAAAMTYRYGGGLAVAIGYDLFIVFAMLVAAPGSYHYHITIIDIIGSLVDAPIVALLTGYVATLITNYANSKKREQANVRRQRALLSVSETIMSEISDRERLLQKAAKQVQHGGHFQRLVIVVPIDKVESQGVEQDEPETISKEASICIEANIADTALPERNPAYVEQVLRTQQQLVSFEKFNQEHYHGAGIARLYIPLFKEGTLQMVIGAESQRQTPFDSKREEFLTIAGGLLLIAMENIRLTEQMIELAATAERGRIARDIHDGIAQLTYMLSLNAETCATQAQRIAEASDEDAELIMPLATRLHKLVKISKQALWETRNYMFSMKPMMNGNTTLSQMLTRQVREFETISNLPIQLQIEGSEERNPADRRRASKYAHIGATIFRIVQEALTNAYKHAEATQLTVHLRYYPDAVEVTVSDDGHGLPSQAGKQETQRIYSGRGVQGMYERAQELGGTCTITPVPAGGVQVQVHLPI
jgi:signal transduction histidine kinase